MDKRNVVTAAIHPSVHGSKMRPSTLSTESLRMGRISIQGRLSLFFTASLLMACQGLAATSGKTLGGQTPNEMYADQRVAELVEAVLADDAVRVRALAETGTDVNALPENGAPPLLWAVHFEHLEAMAALLESGADPCQHIPGLGDDSVFIVVLRTERTEQLKLLLSKGGDPNCPVADRDELSLLGIAAFKGPLAHVRMMVEAGADMHFRNDGYRTVVGRAQAGGNYDIVLYFLESGYRYRLEDVASRNQVSLVDEAHEPQRQAVIAWLKAHGVTYPVLPNQDP